MQVLQKKDINKIAASESANNSGALSSLLPLIILGIPIVASEVLIFYLVASQGFIFNLESLDTFYNVLFYIPITVVICLLLSWLGFNYLAGITSIYKKYKTLFSIDNHIINNINESEYIPYKGMDINMHSLYFCNRIFYS